MSSDPNEHFLAEINKRLTLNLLIQGSAQHAFLTSHYLVRDELNAIDPKLIRLYDQLALGGFIQYWRDDFVLWFGWPERFWKRIQRSKHPFGRHPLLARHGLALAHAAKQRVLGRCWEKGVTRIPCYFTIQFFSRIFWTKWKESAHKAELVELAKKSTHMVWGIPCERLDGALTQIVEFGVTRSPTNLQSIVLRAGAAGYGGVLREGGQLRVVGKAWLWPLLSHELVKGTVELICMHGLVDLDELTYRSVVRAADRIEYEPWMLQVGSELWRQLLPLLPDEPSVAEMVMRIAKLPAQSLETLMLAVVEDPDWARELLVNLGRQAGESEL